MTMQSSYTTIRVYNETRVNPTKKDRSKRAGYQACAILKGEGRQAEFEAYFNPDEKPHFLPPGDYEVKATGLYLDRDGRLQMGREFVPVKQAAKAA